MREDAAATQRMTMPSSLKAWAGRTVVIKYGGAAMTDTTLKQEFARQMALLSMYGIRAVVVHGGGNEITRVATALGIETRFVQGQRYTDAAMIEVVRMVLAGGINKEIVGLLNDIGLEAVGLCGIDASLLRTRRLRPDGIDLGLVGEVVAVRAALLEQLLAGGFVPVIAPLGSGTEGEIHNINADIAAAAIAQALRADRLVFLSDIDGIHDGEEIVPQLTVPEAAVLIERGVISGGMIPKLQASLDAIESGVGTVHITDGRRRSSLLDSFGNAPGGTWISNNATFSSTRNFYAHEQAFPVAT
jgi:acetylglutamate kinase